MAQTHNTSYLGMLSMPADPPDAKVMIDVDHVTMAFNIASEQLNSLKEYAIALSRRELRFKEFLALDDVSFQVKKGDVFGILGTNGSGKSTVLKIIAGVLEPTRGTCTVAGSIAPLIELGAGFDLELTARENIFLNGALLGYSKKFIKEHFDEIVEFAEVRDFLDMPMKNYSSGMVARIAFAIATVIVPDVLIVDEVLSVGDFLFQQKCERRIQSLINDHGVTVLIVSHSNEQIERLCNKAAWIEKGHLRAIGSAKEVCDLYRAIGGRSGSPESEKAILEMIDLDEPLASDLHRCLFGDNLCGTTIQMSNYDRLNKSTCLLVSGESERECRIACGLAGLLDASVLSIEPNKLPDLLRQELKRSTPSRIIVLGEQRSVSDSLLEELQAICPSATIDRTESDSDSNGADTYLFGIQSRLKWANTAIIGDERFDFSMTILSPLLFRYGIPTFYPSNGVLSEKVTELLSNFTRVITFEDETSSLYSQITQACPHAEIVNFPEPNVCKVNDILNRFIMEYRNSESANCSLEGFSTETLVVTDPDNRMDNRFVGPLAGRMRSLILLAGSTDLDSTANAIAKLGSMDAPPSRLLFIGSSLRYPEFNKDLLAKALARNPRFSPCANQEAGNGIA